MGAEDMSLMYWRSGNEFPNSVWAKCFEWRKYDEIRCHSYAADAARFLGYIFCLLLLVAFIFCWSLSFVSSCGSGSRYLKWM